MVAGHLSVKNGNYYAVLNYKNAEGKRKTKWISLGLPEKGNKRKADALQSIMLLDTGRYNYLQCRLLASHTDAIIR